MEESINSPPVYFFGASENFLALRPTFFSRNSRWYVLHSSESTPANFWMFCPKVTPLQLMDSEHEYILYGILWSCGGTLSTASSPQPVHRVLTVGSTSICALTIVIWMLVNPFTTGCRALHDHIIAICKLPCQLWASREVDREGPKSLG